MTSSPDGVGSRVGAASREELGTRGPRCVQPARERNQHHQGTLTAAQSNRTKGEGEEKRTLRDLQWWGRGREDAREQRRGRWEQLEQRWRRIWPASRAAGRRRRERRGEGDRGRGLGRGRGEGKGIEGEGSAEVGGTILMAHHPSVRHKYIHTNGAPHPGAPLVFFLISARANRLSST